MKKINTLLSTSLILSFAFFSCSKKMVVNSNDANFKKYSQQLEMNYDAHQNTQIASIDNGTIEPVKYETRFENVPERVETKAMASKKNKLGFKQKVALIKDQIQNINTSKTKILNGEKITTETAQVSGRLRTGIILGAIGLAMLITAGFFGGASGIIYVGGAVLFIVGLVFILIAVL